MIKLRAGTSDKLSQVFFYPVPIKTGDTIQKGRECRLLLFFAVGQCVVLSNGLHAPSKCSWAISLEIRFRSFPLDLAF